MKYKQNNENIMKNMKTKDRKYERNNEKELNEQVQRCAGE